MARPWIEFVQSQRLPWTAHDLWGVRPGIEAKILSRDPDDGAASLLVRYPVGWNEPVPPVLAVDEEVLVLDGALTVGDRSHGTMGYAHLPGGCVRGPMAAPAGAVALVFFSGTPRPGPAGGYDPARLLPGVDALAIPYTGNFHPQFPPGAGRKMLFQDPATGDQTWILGTLPLRWAERSEVHPVVEEMYLLSGEVHGNRGVMRPGAYFWRPPLVAHGPYGSLTGNLYFFRTKGGPLSTDYVDPERPFRWWPGDDPVLPPEMAAAVAGDATHAPRPW